jgi:hypothetical protein
MVPPVREDRRRTGVEWLAWLAVLLVAVVLLAATGFQSRDPDSALHAHIAARLAELPAWRWIAPEWWGGMGSEGPYREHPAGIFLLPALVGALGYPALQAAYAVNAAYQVLTLVVAQRLAATVVAPVEARALAWLLQLLPIAFTYRIRANHEQPLLLALLLALWATERARATARLAPLVALAALGTLLVKGLFAVFVLAWCASWLLTVGRADGRPPRADAPAWLGLGGAAALCLGVAAGYDRLYRHVTGESFLAYYVGSQLGRAAVPRGGSAALQKLANAAWYLAHLLWFPLPASVAAARAAWVTWAERRATGRLGRAGVAARDRQALAFVVTVVAAYVLLFSVSDRVADRYIFPAYWLLGAAGLVALMRAWPGLRRSVEALDAGHPVFAAALWLGLFGLSLASATLQVPWPVLWSGG